jgi:hypothetical protein
MARHTRYLQLAVVASLLGCNNSSSSPGSARVAQTLTRGLEFPRGMLLNDPLPATTDPRATLLPLGPTVVLEPSRGTIMALEVDDPDDRHVNATLLQFEGEGTHIRVPDDQKQSGGVVENDFVVAKTLCKGLCNAVFTVQVKEKVELEDGAISGSTTRDVVVDCRKSGDPAVCAPKGQDAGPGGGEKSLCGDVTKGQIALTGDRVLDAHLDAVRQLGRVTGLAEDEIKSALSTLAMALGLDKGSSATEISTALATRISEQSAAGLALLLGQPGCGVRREQVALALRVCDPDGVSSLDALQCTGTCAPIADASVCADAPSSGCRGLLEGAACGGRCTGACKITLDAPTACMGTCVGTCDGTCPGDGSASCAGPCSGLCTGACKTLSSESCAGECTGLCDASQSGVPSCAAPLTGYCQSATDAPLACPGDCFGSVAVTKGSDLCRTSAIAVAESFPRCAPPLVQLSFAFAPGLSASDQAAFATFVHDLDAPFAKLYDALGRIALLSLEDADLTTAAKGAIQDDLAQKLMASPEDSGLGCATKRLPETTAWLETEMTALSGLREDAMQVLSTVEVMQ